MPTPKRGSADATKSYSIGLQGLPGLELLLAGWSAWSVVQAVQLGLWGAIPFLLLFLGGFSWVGLLSLRGYFGQRA